nr:helix-turn-helix domain-containing protein [Sinorhizobium meliloti]
MDERLKFVARVLDGEKIAVLCREFGISRKTGHKIISRYNACGLEGLTDRSRRPYRHANQLPFQIEKLIVRAKQEKPNWGAPKIRERLARALPGRANAGDLNRARGARPQRAGRAPQATAKQGTGNTTLPTVSSERLVVRRSQG